MRLSRLLLALLVLALVGTTTPAYAAHADDPGAAVHLTGRGYGHGHGLSQWGAEGAAIKGLSYHRILDFYYPGLKRSTIAGQVSVLITGDTSADVVVSARPGLTVKALGNGRTYQLRKNATQWRITPDQNGHRSAIVYRTAGAGGWHTLRSVPGEAQFDAGGAPITLHTPTANVAYRGILRSVAPTATSRTRETVNVLPLESYLKGVVPREAFPTWRPAALQAQAVAARTYAAFERRQPLARGYQICDTAACQVYGGSSSEVASTTAAVNATKREILTSGGTPAFTQFSASNGGWTTDGGKPYLPAQQDPYDKAYRNWHATITAAQLEKAYPVIGSFDSLSVLSRDGHGQWNGRVTNVEITGSLGATVVTGDEFRSRFALMSTWFTPS